MGLIFKGQESEKKKKAEISLNNYYTMPLNIPEEHRAHQHRDGGLKSRNFVF
jgi:hypothetical protein